ncbi:MULTISPECIES: recombinase family protein [Sphingomonadaceae]|jgi:DNA invertase Pin-like site-specific DNA recombinase|uniref:DNA invertase Pin-like site-specific DNA recombinase n=3 Tax=Pseudomonadota TaxID=1224 RepID=A0A4R6FAT9_9SPHN|nr:MULTISPECIES: recombinase family protein [Sphingomonadaceae]MCH4894987.1 helix-turn-helix domain-containing protein [Sphingomonas sp. SFZ2018-12]RSU63250.1 recombinase family protein [Sphingomonas sp. S-NIH.Pt1_0416]RSV34088.1 recombinase family protein [Sphingomonas sp. ABOLE]TDN78173.1 DNA invertase Pin-like site-specific DNA recombinase [Stakelama pacifica]GGO99910.1 invertase [Stakelama pacifica]
MLNMAATPLPGQAGTRRIGYARVSTADQDLAPQLDVLRAKGCEPIYSEHASGKHADRPELAQAMKALRAGDTLVVWRLDRLGRSLPDLIATVNELASRGIAFESVTEAIDTTTASGKLVFNIFASLADFERHLIGERTRAGLAAGRARGRMGGRPPALTSRQLREARLLLTDPDATVTAVAERYGVSRTTLYKGLRELADKEAAA